MGPRTAVGCSSTAESHSPVAVQGQGSQSEEGPSESPTQSSLHHPVPLATVCCREEEIRGHLCQAEGQTGAVSSVGVEYKLENAVLNCFEEVMTMITSADWNHSDGGHCPPAESG